MRNRRLLFLDRDGTIIKEPLPDRQVDSFEKLEFIPGVIKGLSKISGTGIFSLVIVTNQDGLGTNKFPSKNFMGPHMLMLKILKGEGIEFSEVLIDPSMPGTASPGRKPSTGLVEHYINGDFDLSNSYVVGDRISDLEFAKNIGCKSILLTYGSNLSREKKSDLLKGFKCDLVSDSWEEISGYLSKGEVRKKTVKRVTAETDINCTVNLDGNGVANISTGLGFFDHMLEQFVFHSGIDMKLFAKGDLKTGPHHLIEDCAIVIGKAVTESLGNRKGINRYGYFVPMDDSIAEFAIDISGRPYLNWKVEFRREQIGGIPSEMFRHFFYSFSVSSISNIYAKVEGQNDHHKIEAIFKAFGRSLANAIRGRDPSGKIPSTKGVLR